MNIGAVSGASGSAVAVAAAIVQAIKASGAIVKVEPKDFMKIIEKVDNPLIVFSESRFISTRYKYLTSYKGLAFFTRSKSPLHLPANTELVVAKRIWIPG